MDMNAIVLTMVTKATTSTLPFTVPVVSMMVFDHI